MGRSSPATGPDLTIKELSVMQLFPVYGAALANGKLNTGLAMLRMDTSPWFFERGVMSPRELSRISIQDAELEPLIR
jgi:hypothetical protein